MDPQTPTTRLAEHLLGEPLGDWVRRHRADDRSWPWISQRLREQTDGQVDITRTWLWRLYGSPDSDDKPGSGENGSAA